MKRQDHNSGSALLIAVLLVTAMTILGASYLDLVTNGSNGTNFLGSTPQAFYAAEAGVYRLLEQVNSGGASSVSGSLTNSSYTGTYSASYDSATGIITSAGSVVTVSGTATRTVAVRTKSVPAYVRGAVTSNGNATTRSNAILDGRDHDSSGVLTGNPGTYGLSGTGTITQSGSSTIGGNGNAPSGPAASSAIEQNASAFPSTDPWDILGVSQAWFDANVTNTTTAPTSPFSGIVYYTPSSGSWDGADLDGSTGILIVHNATNNAEIDNASGTFKGLIIADKFKEMPGNSATIIGGIVVTNADKKLGGNLNVKYSSQVLADLKSLTGNQTDQWKKVITQGSWQESQ